eukprot:223115_1
MSQSSPNSSRAHRYKRHVTQYTTSSSNSPRRRTFKHTTNNNNASFTNSSNSFSHRSSLSNPNTVHKTPRRQVLTLHTRAQDNPSSNNEYRPRRGNVNFSSNNTPIMTVSDDTFRALMAKQSHSSHPPATKSMYSHSRHRRKVIMTKPLKPDSKPSFQTKSQRKRKRIESENENETQINEDDVEEGEIKNIEDGELIDHESNAKEHKHARKRRKLNTYHHQDTTKNIDHAPQTIKTEDHTTSLPYTPSPPEPMEVQG